MDRSNLAGIEGLRTPDSTAEISLLLDYHPESPGPDVPDPYYGGAGGFDRVLQLVMDACNGFLEQSGHPR
jgi:protein-tyrosine phosphatase